MTTTIHTFARLDYVEKVDLLKNMATLIDTYEDKNNLVFIYTLSGFFVEATINPVTETILDIIPYRRGFLMDKSYLDNHRLGQNFLSYQQVA